MTATAGRFLINGAIEHASLDGCRMGSFLDHTLDELAPATATTKHSRARTVRSSAGPGGGVPLDKLRHPHQNNSRWSTPTESHMVDWSIVATIAAPLITLVAGALLNRAIENRPRLLTYLGHVSAHRLTQADGTPYDVFTHSVVLRNSGRRPATMCASHTGFSPTSMCTLMSSTPSGDLPGGGKVDACPLDLGGRLTSGYQGAVQPFRNSS